MSDRPFVDFSEVKSCIGIPEVLEVLGIRGEFTEKQGVLTGCCPFPDHPHGPKPNKSQFKINQRDGIWLWHCFGDCDAGGDVIEFVKRHQQLSNEHVRFWFADKFGDRLKLKRKGKSRGADKDQVPVDKPANKQASGMKPMRFYLNLDTDAAKAYLTSRGISMEVAERYGVGMCNKGMFDGYLAVPCYRYPKESPDEYPVGYCGRWGGDDFDEQAGRPRYKNGFETGNVVFGVEQAMKAVAGQPKWMPLIIVEGWIKCLNLASRGYPNVVGTFTASLSSEQAAILSATERRLFVLLFDGDEKGKEGMEKAAGLLSLRDRCFVNQVVLPEGQQPDTLSDDEFDSLLGWAKCR